MPEHFSFLFRYIKKLGIQIDQDEFFFQVQSHPNYPSLLSISDTLNFFKIDNFATSVNVIDELPDYSIVLLNDEESGKYLSFVERTRNGYQYTKNEKTIRLTSNEFKNIFANIALIAEKSENEESRSSSKNSSYAKLTVLGLLYLSAIFLNGFYFTTFFFIAIVIVGLYLSIEAISSELGISTKFSKAVCGGPVTESDCNTVINSTKTKLLEIISFSDISITFFVAQLLSILFFSISNQISDFYNLTFISLICSLPVTMYSFYLQKFVAKKWCPICLSIIAVLYVELIFLLFIDNIGISINLRGVIYYSFALIAAYFVSISFKKLLKNNFELKSEILATNRFKRNYAIFKMALTAKGKINTNADIPAGNIILGNPDSKLKIIMITSPYCAYCGGAHKIIEDILELYKDRVAVHVRFNVNPITAEEKGKIVLNKLINIYFNKGQEEFMKAMHTWFSDKDEAKLNSYDTAPNAKINVHHLLLDQYIWNQKNNTTYTPAFIINDYLYPSQYGRDELINFINDLEDDESFVLDQIAYT